MRNTWLLAWAMFRGIQWGGGIGARRTRKINLGRVGNLILAMVMAGYFVTLAVLGVRSVYPLLAPAGMQSALPSLVISLLSLLTFLFGVMYAISVYYHASDVDKLLPLPLRPGQIVLAKFLTTLLYEYILVWLLGLPALITYGVLEGAGALFYFRALVILLFLPVTPLALASVLVILLMRFAPAARNKDRFNMVANIGIMAVTLLLVFGMQRLQSLSGPDLITALAHNAAALARVTAGVFPGSAFAAAALADSAGRGLTLDLPGFLLICAASVALLLLCARAFYFKGVMGVGASFARQRALSRTEVASFAASGSAFWLYVLKEFRILLRTPIFFMNNLLMNLLFPVFFLAPLLLSTTGDTVELKAALVSLRAAAFAPGAIAGPIVLGGLASVVIFICGTHGITASAISRDGSSAYFMKIIPMSYRAQVYAKVMTGVLVSAVPGVIVLVAAGVVLRPPLWFVPLLIVTLAAALVLPNLAGILFDLRRPKLDWIDEQKAVKQNMNVLYTMGIAAMAGALAVVPPLLLQLRYQAAATPYSYALVVVYLLLADGWLYWLVRRSASRDLRAMQA